MKNRIRRALALVLTLNLLSSLLCVTAFAADEPWSGGGTADDPYLIEDAADLEALAANVNNGTSKYSGEYFKLTADLEVSDWEPIGYSSKYYFSGDFDGNGHTITIHGIDLAAQHARSGMDALYGYCGLFGYTYYSGSGTSMSYAKIHDLTVSGNMDTSAWSTTYVRAGGIVGHSYACAVVNCVSTINITGSGDSYKGYAGGIAGYTESAYNYIYNCYSSGVLSAGLTGGITAYDKGGTYQYCYTAAEAVCGRNYSTQTECCTAAIWAVFPDEARSAWVDAANASVSGYTSVTDFWSLDSDGFPEHVTCEHVDHVATDTVVAPTCTEEGFTIYHCNDCGKDYKSDYTDALGHDLETVTVEPGCTEPGSVTKICRRDGCGYTSAAAIPALGHTPKEGSQVEYAFYYEYTCARCGGTYAVCKDERIRAMEVTGVEVSFSEDGAYEWEYDESGGRLRSTNYGVNASVSQTTVTLTSQSGLTLGFDYAVSSESNYDKLTITLDSTTVANAISGTASGSYASGELEAGTHTLVMKYEKDNSVLGNEDRGYLSNIVVETLCAHENRSNERHEDAACTEDGWDSFHCEDCGGDIVTVIPATGHTWVDGEVVTEPTCGAEGQRVQVCSACGAAQTAAIPATREHVFDDAGICTVCGAKDEWDGKTVIEPAADADGVYLIREGAELAWFRSTVNAGNDTASARLTRNINMGAHSWTPIGGAAVSAGYQGTFDGGGYTVTLNYSTTSDYQGLFSYVGRNGVVRNVAVAGSITGGAHTGGVAAYNYGTIESCVNRADVTVSSTMTVYVGGIVGYNYGTVRACGNEGAVSGRASSPYAGTYAGGIFGYCGYNLSAVGSGTTYIENCCNWGGVSAVTTSSEMSQSYWAIAGGIGGNWSGNGSGQSERYLRNCYSTGAVSAAAGSAASVAAGGIVGLALSTSGTIAARSRMENCWYLEGTAPAAFTLSGDYAAAAVTKVGTKTAVELKSEEFLADDIAGYQLNCGTYPVLSWQTAVEHTMPESGVTTVAPTCTGDGYAGYVCAVCGEVVGTVIPALGHTWEDVEVIVEATCGADGRTRRRCTVCNEEQLAAVPATRAHSFADGVCTVCGAKDEWDGVTILEPAADENGVYLITEGAELAWFRDTVNAGNFAASARLTRDINMGAHTWTPIVSAASPAGYSGTFDGGGHTVTLNYATAEDYQGLFGYIGRDGAVRNVTLAGSITGDAHTGGIAVYHYGTIEYCVNKAAVTGVSATASACVGGIAVYHYGIIRNCVNEGAVTGSTTHYTGTAYVGGIFSYCGSDAAAVGGGATYVENCYNRGGVSAYTASFYNAAAGGIGGCWYGSADCYKYLRNCYSTGAVSAVGFQSGTSGYCKAGGIVGLAYAANNIAAKSVMTNCWYLDSAASAAYNASSDAFSAVTETGVGAKTAAELRSEDFAANDIEGYQFIPGGYPVLAWQTAERAAKGDVNGDGRVNAVDAMLVLRAAAGLITLTDAQSAAADVNNDGGVDSTDARLILGYSIGKIPALG